jgi:hypothetical protein
MIPFIRRIFGAYATQDEIPGVNLVRSAMEDDALAEYRLPLDVGSHFSELFSHPDRFALKDMQDIIEEARPFFENIPGMMASDNRFVEARIDQADDRERAYTGTFNLWVNKSYYDPNVIFGAGISFCGVVASANESFGKRNIDELLAYAEEFNGEGYDYLSDHKGVHITVPGRTKIHLRDIFKEYNVRVVSGVDNHQPADLPEIGFGYNLVPNQGDYCSGLLLVIDGIFVRGVCEPLQRSMVINNKRYHSVNEKHRPDFDFTFSRVEPDDIILRNKCRSPLVLYVEQVAEKPPYNPTE